jgi:hypothetical protein
MKAIVIDGDGGIDRLRLDEVGHWSRTASREKLIKIGAKVVTHAKARTFQMADVTVPRTLSAAILDRSFGCGRFRGPAERRARRAARTPRRAGRWRAVPMGPTPAIGGMRVPAALAFTPQDTVISKNYWFFLSLYLLLVGENCHDGHSDLPDEAIARLGQGPIWGIPAGKSWLTGAPPRC